MTGKKKTTMTPEVAQALAQYVDIPLPGDAVGGVITIIQSAVDVLGTVSAASLRDVEPAFIQPLRREGGRRRA